MKIFYFLFMASAVCCAQHQQLVFLGKPQIFMPHFVCTEKSEIKITFSSDGNHMLWGAIGWIEGKKDWDIWESVKDGDTWERPHTVSFCSDSNDFDPCFSPDGRRVYFFSNRSNGFGGDDIYSVEFDTNTGTYGRATNLGTNINSLGDEWGPVLSPDGTTLLFCSDGRGGFGKHDLFISHIENGILQPAENLGSAINSSLDDFDPVFLHDGNTIIFASERGKKSNVYLYVSYKENHQYTLPVLIDTTINSANSWNFGCSINFLEPGVLYYSSHHPDNAIGKVDIYSTQYKLK
jgi:TolB protein